MEDLFFFEKKKTINIKFFDTLTEKKKKKRAEKSIQEMYIHLHAYTYYFIIISFLTFFFVLKIKTVY
jgi:hypothetical protein